MTKRTCSIPGCDDKHKAHGWCKRHYERYRYHGDPLVAVPRRRYRQQGCKIPECQRPHYARGWCRGHWEAWRTHGNPNVRLRALNGQADFYSEGYHCIHVNGRVVKEHRYIMEQHLGRPLARWEHVHHRNGDRGDNRLSNLELWATRQPKGQRAKDLLVWAEEIVARYGPERDKL